MNDWNALWGEFDATCGRCHDTQNPPDPDDGTGAFAYDGSLPNGGRENAYRELNANFYANPIAGALGSPAFWAARGGPGRTDGRSDAPYAGLSPTFMYSIEHASAPEITQHCDGNVATGSPQWVYDFGQWIDNHMPRDNPLHTGGYGYFRDRFHPTVDFAISTSTCSPKKIRIGHWDDSGDLKSLEVIVDGMTEKLYETAMGDKLTNVKGKRVHKFTGPMTSDTLVEVVVTDEADNRQFYSKRVSELERECVPSDREPIDPVPFP